MILIIPTSRLGHSRCLIPILGSSSGVSDFFFSLTPGLCETCSSYPLKNCDFHMTVLHFLLIKKIFPSLWSSCTKLNESSGGGYQLHYLIRFFLSMSPPPPVSTKNKFPYLISCPRLWRETITDDIFPLVVCISSGICWGFDDEVEPLVFTRDGFLKLIKINVFIVLCRRLVEVFMRVVV